MGSNVFSLRRRRSCKKQLVGLNSPSQLNGKKISEEVFQSAKSEIDSLRKESQSLKSKVSELKDSLQELNQAKPPSNYLEHLKKIASARKLVEEKDAAVKQLLAAIQATCHSSGTPKRSRPM